MQLLYTTFNGDEKALHALIKANMLRLTYKDNNKIESVTAFSPLYAYSFKKMVSNPKMSAGIGIAVKKFEIEQETAKMNRILDEMVKLRTLVYKVKTRRFNYVRLRHVIYHTSGLSVGRY